MAEHGRALSAAKAPERPPAESNLGPLVAGPPVFVPFALPLDQAEHAWGAVKAVLDSCRAAGRPPTEYAPLAAALITMGKAIEKVTNG